eukprot:Skav221750  [mRNA]  locus=scaffold3834:71231:73805:- [translate_table: standard]
MEFLTSYLRSSEICGDYRHSWQWGYGMVQSGNALPNVMLLWDQLLLQPPQFQLFVALCLVHFFRESLLSLEEASHICTFLSNCAQLIDCQILISAALEFFQAVPASITLAIYPRHSAGEALMFEPGAATKIAADPSWGYLEPCWASTEPHENSEDEAQRNWGWK